MENEEENAQSNTERTPLIQPAKEPSHPRHSSGSSSDQRRPVIAVAPVNPDEQPVPMAPSAMSAVGGVPTINCRICRSLISLDGKLGNHVVKCPTCNEATPIRPAPEGKRYVRCPCGCLLVCKQGASRISCPRDHCRRVLSLTTPSGSTPAEVEVSRLSGSGPTSNLVVSHLQCPSCCLSFLLQSDPATPYAKCPHCSARAVLHTSYIRLRSVLFGILSFLFLVGGVGCLVGTWDLVFDHRTFGLIAAWSSLFLLALVFGLVSVYFGTMKVAKMMPSATSYGAAPNGHGRYAYA